MKVLFAAWEMDPYFKVGGLGDVVRSLPNALSQLGVDVRVIMPFYKSLKLEGSLKKRVAKTEVLYGKKLQKVIIYKVINSLAKVPVYLVQNKKYLDVATSQETFAFFDKAVVDIIKNKVINFIPDIIHCHDHHTGLIPFLIKNSNLKVKSVLTLHNLAYQGFSPVDVLAKLSINRSDMRLSKWEINSRKLNFLLEGIIHADIVTTVSPTYSKEILKEMYGMGLEDVLRDYRHKLYGILNGIDIDYNYLLHFKHVPFPFLEPDEKDRAMKHYPVAEGKKLNKQFLQQQLGLKNDETIPLFAFIGRFDAKQKGIDILHKMIRRYALKNEQYQFVILGTGDPDWEERFDWLYNFYPESVSCNFVFDTKLAQIIYAAADFILIPSKFEPCGLIQMLAMAFGTLPIAHKVGGLTDSIKNRVNGYLFPEYSAKKLFETMEKAVKIWQKDKINHFKMIKAAMKEDFSWRRSAGEYLDLYKKLIAR